MNPPPWNRWKIIPRDPRMPERGHIIVATNSRRDFNRWFPVWPRPRFDDPIQSLGKCEAYAKNRPEILPPQNREVDA
jgi:hypothetical protein